MSTSGPYQTERGPYPTFHVLPTTSAQMDDFRHHMTQVFSEMSEAMPRTEEGTIVGDSYDPSSCTAEVLFGDTYSIFGDDGPAGDAYINHQKLPILTTAPGDLYGPTGLERAICLPTSCGYGIVFKTWQNDTPMVPAGERWMLHKTVATQQQYSPVQYDSGLKFTNDAATPGDGKGGTQLGYKGARTAAVTNSGHQVTLDDTAQTITVETASQKLSTILNDVQQKITTTAGTAGTYQLFDGANNLISLVVPSGGGIGVGNLWGNLGAAFAAARNNDLATFATSIQTMVGNALQQAAQAAITASVPNAAVWLTTIQGGLPSLSFINLASSIASLSAPNCSSLVRIAG